MMLLYSTVLLAPRLDRRDKKKEKVEARRGMRETLVSGLNRNRIDLCSFGGILLVKGGQLCLRSTCRSK